LNRLSRTALLALSIVAFALPAASAAAQDGGAAEASITTTTNEIDRQGQRLVQIDVGVEDVTNLGAFQFVLNFDGQIVRPAEDTPAQPGGFLASSGREVFCPDIVVDDNAIRYACVTLGDEPAEGAAGSGLLATFFFIPNEGGSTTLEFTRAQLATPMGDGIDTTWEPGQIVIGSNDSGNRWAMWAAIGGVAAVGAVAVAGFSMYRRRRATATQITIE
jgi:hypothetical protein